MSNPHRSAGLGQLRMRDSTGAPAHALPDCRGACAVAVSGPRGRVFPPGLRGPQRSPARSCHGLPAARAMGLSSDCPVRGEPPAAGPRHPYPDCHLDHHKGRRRPAGRWQDAGAGRHPGPGLLPPASHAVSNQTSGDAVHPKIPLPILRP